MGAIWVVDGTRRTKVFFLPIPPLSCFSSLAYFHTWQLHIFHSFAYSFISLVRCPQACFKPSALRGLTLEHTAHSSFSVASRRAARETISDTRAIPLLLLLFGEAGSVLQPCISLIGPITFFLLGLSVIALSGLSPFTSSLLCLHSSGHTAINILSRARAQTLFDNYIPPVACGFQVADETHGTNRINTLSARCPRLRP